MYPGRRLCYRPFAIKIPGGSLGHMRAGIAISVIVHAAIVLWLVLAPGSKPFDPAYADAVVVDLLPSKDDPTDREPPKPDESKPDAPTLDLPKLGLSKPDLPKPDLAKQALPKPEPPKPASAKPDSKPPIKPEPPKPVAETKQLPKEQAGASLDETAETAARLAWMLEGPPILPVDLAARPTKSNLPAELVAEIKGRVSKCLEQPPDVRPLDASGRSSLVVLHVELTRDGALSAEPELMQAPATEDGPPRVQRAKRALRQCQPYGFLPADKYADWRALELSFTDEGLAGVTAYKRSAAR
jgi:hypothetical protein